MHKSVVEGYQQLWHYTTALGLHGILTSQQIWATNISYLSDAEELTGFFDRKLLRLLVEGVREGVTELRKTAEGLSIIDAAGGQEKLVKDVPNQLLDSLRAATLNLKFFYVTSFCNTATGGDSEDGLLSQWRGYGPDGGYAIVFDTQGSTNYYARSKAHICTPLGTGAMLITTMATLRMGQRIRRRSIGKPLFGER